MDRQYMIGFRLRLIEQLRGKAGISEESRRFLEGKLAKVNHSLGIVEGERERKAAEAKEARRKIAEEADYANRTGFHPGPIG